MVIENKGMREKDMNILFCSAGRRCQLLQDFRKSMWKNGKIIATDMSVTAPAIYMADKFYIVPAVNDEKYISIIFDICRKEEIDVITTLIDPEIRILAEHREEFRKLGVEVLAPYSETAEICFDKYEMFKYLKENGIDTVMTYGDIESFVKGLDENKIQFPVFVKPLKPNNPVSNRLLWFQTINDLKHLIFVSGFFYRYNKCRLYSVNLPGDRCWLFESERMKLSHLL